VAKRAVIEPVSAAAYDLLHRGALVMASIEQAGMLVDLDYCRRQERRLKRKMREAEADLAATDLGRRWRKRYGAGMSVSKDQQLAAVLYGDMGLTPAAETVTGKPSTAWAALEQLDVPGLEHVRDWRRHDKARGTYLANLLRETGEDGLFRPEFHLNTVRTYRGSAELFQTVPKRDPGQGRAVRRAFRARPGRRIVETDYSGIEVRVGACLHRDRNMISYLEGEGDMHRDAACDLFKLRPEQVHRATVRDIAKNGWVFPQFYGSWWKNCAPNIWRRVPSARLQDGTPLLEHLKSAGIGTPKKFLAHAERAERALWEGQFPEYARWKDRWYGEYLERGYFEMPTGFRCGGVMSRNDACNYPIQGPAFHCLLQSLIWIHEEIERRGLETLIIGQIHDAIVKDVPVSESDEVLGLTFDTATKRLVREWKWIVVPLEVEADATPVGGSWYEKTPVRMAPGNCTHCGSAWDRDRKGGTGTECLTCGKEGVPF
jgi:DNA polymerase-1